MEKTANAKRFDFQPNVINKTYIRMYWAWTMELANLLRKIYAKLDDDVGLPEGYVCVLCSWERKSVQIVYLVVLG